jgi:hypothetical protein
MEIIGALIEVHVSICNISSKVGGAYVYAIFVFELLINIEYFIISRV